MMVPVYLSQANANDSAATLVRWMTAPGSRVEKGEPLALFETTKAIYEVEAPASGWLLARAEIGSSVEIGAVIAEMLPHPTEAAAMEPPVRLIRRITEKARHLMEKHGISEASLPEDLTLVRENDILALIKEAEPEPDADPDPDGVMDRADFLQLSGLLSGLRERMRTKHNRHVPTGTLLNDRWRLAEALNFGPGSSVYDECLILGDVKVGANCWVGPYTVLDGSAGRLEIGEWTDIGTGSHLYTHHTIDRALSGGMVKPFGAPTRIGKCCFIAPMVMVAPGTHIGDHSFVAAFSYVEGHFPPFSYIAGAPARVVGSVEIRDGRVVRKLFDKDHGE
jgi:carbonic anhydrase/acetyltransferase-like protein (isoleucine patch superfamily)